MTPAKIAEYKKALGALIGTLVGLGLAVLSLNVLDGAVAHDVAIACAVGTALLGPLGAALAPPNGPKTNVLVNDVKALMSNATEIHQVLRDAAAELEQIQHPLITTGVFMPAGTGAFPLNETHVTGGTVAPPELEPAGTEGN